MGLTQAQADHLVRNPGLTWHHHQDVGRMQLVSVDEHEAAVPHTGGRVRIECGGLKSHDFGLLRA
jgi:hypothetical protein